MIRIAVTETGTDAKQQNYINWLRAAGDCEPVTVSSADPHTDEWDGFDGLLLSGGIDVDPAFYGGARQYANAPQSFNTERDRFERELFHHFLAKAAPVLGICRGMQLINALSGGTLVQDLGEAGNETHRAHPSDKRHGLRVKQGSQLDAILGPGSIPGATPGSMQVPGPGIEINSAHHQCILQPAPGFRITAWSADDIPEGLERTAPGPSYLLGVQWHPERMYQLGLGDSPASLGVRASFIEAANAFYQQSISKHEDL